MIAVLRGSWALFLGIGLLMLGTSLLGTLLGLRASLAGFPTWATGLVMSAFYAGFLVGSTVTPVILARVGHIRTFGALASLASAAALLHVVVIDPLAWGAIRLVSGFCQAGLYVVAESWLNDRADNQTRGSLLGIYMVVMLGGMALGQLLLNLGEPGGFELFILVSVLVSLSVVPILITASAAPDFAQAEPLKLGDLYRASPLGVVGCFGVGLAHGSFFGFAAVYAALRNLDPAEISVFIAAFLFGGIALQWPIGRASDRYDRRRVLMAVAAGAALLAALFAYRAPTGPELLGLAFLFGAMTLPLYSLAVAHTNDHLTPKQMVAGSSALVLVSGLGAILGPAMAGGIVSLLGPDGFFDHLAAVHGAIVGFTLWRMIRRPPLPAADQGAYVAMPPRATQVASELGRRVRDQRDRDFARMAPH